MPARRDAEDVWFWACTSLGMHRVTDEVQNEFRPHRPEEVRRALDRLYRRRRRAPGQEECDRREDDTRPRCQPTAAAAISSGGWGSVNDGGTSVGVTFPHV